MAKKKQPIIQNKEETIQETIITPTNISVTSYYNKFIPYLVFIVLAFLVYASSIMNAYALDDLLAITGNKFVLKGFGGLKEIFSTDAFVGFFGERGATLISGGRYRPLAFASFAMEYSLYGLKPHVSHAINVFLFALLSCSIYYFLEMLPKEKFPILKNNNSIYFSVSFLVTILFVLHPIHTEVVANIKGRDELLGMLFSMGALIFTLKYIKTNGMPWIVFAIVLFFLGLLSKENPITFLAVIPLCVFIFYKDKFIDKKFIISMVLLLVTTILYLKLRATFTATSVADESPEILNNPFVRANFEDKWATIFYSFIMYFKLLFFPHPLTHDYYFNQIPYQSFSSFLVILSFLIHMGLAYSFIKNLLNRNAIAFAIGFYFLTLSIVSNVFFTVGIIMNERFVFMPSLGFILLVVIIWLEQINKRNMSLQTNAGIFIIVCCLFSYKTFSRNFAWKNNHILFETDVQTSSNSAKITTALAADYLELVDSTTDENEKREWCQKSLDMVNQAIDIYPENSGAYLLKGNAIFKRNQNYDSAILCFKLALYYRPKDYFDGNFNLAATYMNQKKYDSSLIYSKEAFRINSNHSASGNILAFSYLMNGQLEDAEKIFNQVAIIEKKEVFKSEISKWIYYADHLKDAGNYDKAFEFYNSILAKEPENADANYGKGIILGKVMNQLANSIPFLEKAVRLDDTKIAWKEDLAVAYGFSKQYAKTISLLESVIKAEPNYANAYQNLAASYANLGNKEKSIYYAELAKTKVPK